MKQTVIFKRTEILKVEIEVIQPLAKATLETLYNSHQSLGRPGQERILQHEVTPFGVTKAEPSCECSAQPKKRKTR